MSDMSLELREVHYDINERQGRKIACKAEPIVQEETTDARVIGRVMGVRESKKKAGKKTLVGFQRSVRFMVVARFTIITNKDSAIRWLHRNQQ
ncbi:hypothetical protein BGZ65_011093 [Modicella reniformis]|uniref:Uncharacterized protein n=1 Tax=Modicella reniformis TaxID=1440133 RepID=A0A9P6IHS1_9FUNG|nr:hypothetical protein BGZ65_011093 [Modicella reniformis]